jgi:hypothetical protein
LAAEWVRGERARRFDATYKNDAMAAIASGANRVAAGANDLIAMFKKKIAWLMQKLEGMDLWMGFFLDSLPEGSIAALAASSNSTMGKVRCAAPCAPVRRTYAPPVASRLVSTASAPHPPRDRS